MKRNKHSNTPRYITLGNKIFATLKRKSDLEYVRGADFKSAFIFVLARQVF